MQVGEEVEHEAETDFFRSSEIESIVDQLGSICKMDVSVACSVEIIYDQSPIFVFVVDTVIT